MGVNHFFLEKPTNEQPPLCNLIQSHKPKIEKIVTVRNRDETFVTVFNLYNLKSNYFEGHELKPWPKIFIMALVVYGNAFEKPWSWFVAVTIMTIGHRFGPWPTLTLGRNTSHFCWTWSQFITVKLFAEFLKNNNFLMLSLSLGLHLPKLKIYIYTHKHISQIQAKNTLHFNHLGFVW